MDTTDKQGDLEAAIIAAFDEYMKAVKGRELTQKEIACVLRPVSSILFQITD